MDNASGKAVGQVEFADALLTTRRGGQALQQAVVTIRANQRAGTASTKTKGEVAGHGQKPWRQKAPAMPAAIVSSPIWRGGGVVFGPKPRSYAKSLNRKMAKLALWRALSDKISAGQLLVLDEVQVGEAKTKALVALLKGLKIESKVLLVVEQIGRELGLSRTCPGSRRLPRLHPTWQVLKYPQVVISKAALEQLQIRLDVAEEKAS